MIEIRFPIRVLNFMNVATIVKKSSKENDPIKSQGKYTECHSPQTSGQTSRVV